MTERPISPGERNERRNARIRQLREQREAPIRRRKSFQPLVLLAWLAGVAVLAAIVIFLGFLAFAPRLLAWVEENPGWIEQGAVRDFVQWYQPDELKDVPASKTRERITVTVPPGTTDSQIGDILLQKGVIKSQLAFQYAVLNAGRSGTLAAGVYDLSPTMRPSQIVAALRQFAAPEVTVRLGEGWRLEQIVAELAKSDLTMNIDEFVKLVKTPPADLLKQYDFFADLPVGRTLEGYLPPNTYRIDGNAKAIDVLKVFLDEFNKNLTAEIRDQLAKRGKTVDYAVTLASIVEREAVLEKERPLIAGVYT
ncbi:MAG: endolytic transglycosylase MltG, partial [Chloroflexota bacterium]|nr:endolytic transglycosylase MltG [Chloroflexota bacterium]